MLMAPSGKCRASGAPRRRVRARHALVPLLLLFSCEVVTGLTGERQLLPASAASGTRGFAAETESAGGAGGGEASPPLVSAEAGSGELVPKDGGVGGEHGGARGAPEGESAGDSATEAFGGAAGAPVRPSADAGSAGTLAEPEELLESDPGVLLASPSCAEPRFDCGSVDPCRTILIAGGELDMGRSDSGADHFDGGEPDERPEHRVRVSPFLLDKYEVTVGRFRRFVESYAGAPPANSGAHPGIRGSGWQSLWNERLPVDGEALRERLEALDAAWRAWTPSPADNECHPINYLDWFLGFAFCIWDGGRLPTEAEWEFAAAGGGENRRFPWGESAPDATRAVFDCIASGAPGCSLRDLLPVGSRSPEGDGRFGHADLAGSLLELTRDGYEQDFYSRDSARGTDVVNLSFDVGSLYSVARGGSFASYGAGLRSAARGYVSRATRSWATGVRCARSERSGVEAAGSVSTQVGEAAGPMQASEIP